MNLFQSILDKAKGGVNYLASGKLGSDVYDEFNAQDPTQTMRYKAVQGAANLYTGVAEEAGMGGQRDFEQQISQKRQAFISDMLAKGYDKNAIFEAMDSLQAKGEFDYKPNFMGRVREGLGNRMLETARTTETLSNVQNPLQRIGVGTLAYGGDVVATAMEPVASAVSPFVQAGIEKSGLAPTVQNLGQQFQGFKERNPLTGEAIEGIANLSQLAPVPLVKPAGEMITKGGKAIVRGAEAVAPKVVQGVKTGAEATGEGISKVTKSIVSQQSGLGAEAIESILKTPELQSKIRSGELSAARTLEEARTGIDTLREGFRETGKMYDTVRKSDIKIPKTEAKNLFMKQLEGEGLITDGKLDLRDLSVSDRGAITQALKYLDEYGQEMNAKNALSIRQKLDDLIDYKSDVRSNGQRIVQGLRTKFDEYLGQKLPGLKEIDAKYAPERQFWDSIRKDIYKADGTLKDNALSVISNLTNKGNEARLARMEQIMPGIGKKVQALKAFEDIQNASGIKVGTYTRAATTGGLALVNPFVAIATWVATHPVVVSRVLEGIGLASKKIKAIISKGKNITKEEATIIQKAVAETSKSKVENIINNLSYDPKTSELTSKTLLKNGNNRTNTVLSSNKGNIGKMEQKPSPQVKPVEKTNLSKNAKQQVSNSNASDTIPEGYFRNIFGEIQPLPSNKKGGFIKVPGGKPIVKRASDVDNGLIEEAKKYRNLEEFKALGFDKILEDLRGVKNDSIVEIPTKDIKIVWKQDLENAKEFAKKDYNINTAPPVELTYDIKTGKYILEDGHHRYISAVRNKSKLKGKIDGIKGNMEELASIYEKEKGISLKQIYEQANSPQKTVKPLTPKKQSMGDMETKKLIEEARKYKSAEEFINSRKLYHGTSSEKYNNILKTGFKTPRELAKDGKFEIMMMEDHVSFTTDKKVAERYALRDKKGGKIVEINKSELNLLNDKTNRWKDGEDWTDFIKRLEKEGYDGIDGSLGHPDFKDYYQPPGASGDTEVLIWNTKKIKEMTKEAELKLKQIYEQAKSQQKTIKPKK